MACCIFMFDKTPPAKADATGSSGAKYGLLLAMQDRPNAFQTNLCDAPCKSPMCCLITGLCPCIMAAQHRERALTQYGQGVKDYVCCQGYIPKICCCDFPNMGKGSACCMWVEGVCCDSLSISITRIYVMDAKNLHPDPVDYQIIRFSNCMQILACICNILAMIVDEIRPLAQLVNCAADITERCVLGCMAAQIDLEVKHSVANGGAPAVAIADEVKDAKEAAVVATAVIARE
jgi:hypothetical protein